MGQPLVLLHNAAEALPLYTTSGRQKWYGSIKKCQESIIKDQESMICDFFAPSPPKERNHLHKKNTHSGGSRAALKCVFNV